MLDLVKQLKSTISGHLNLLKSELTHQPRRLKEGVADRVQTPFTLKPKQLALKKAIFNPPKILPKLKKIYILLYQETF